jgi:predicted Zn-dependent protease
VFLKHPHFHKSRVRYLKQAAESASQGEKKDVAADVLWVEAAQMAIEMEEFGKAHGYLLKALALNPQNPSARQLLRDLTLLGIAPR